MKNKVFINSIKHITHDVLQIRTDRPEGLIFEPGQATEISIDRPGWRDEKRPFTFTSLPKLEFLEFTIKTYPQQHGVTEELLHLKTGDALVLHDVFGTIKYKGEGTFIAGGAGVTPFICILRDLWDQHKIGKNQLIFANKKRSDIILKEEFEKMLGDGFINILSEEKTEDFAHGFITEDFLKKHIEESTSYIYLCGPEAMLEMLEKQLTNLGIEKNRIVKEEF